MKTLYGTVCVLALLVACNGTPTPTQNECLALATRVADVNATLEAWETSVPELYVTCAALWDSCCVPATAAAETATIVAQTPVLSATPVYATPYPTYTMWPTPTPESPLCHRCLINALDACPPGYFCKLCDVCHPYCVRLDFPNADCNYCLALGLP